MNMPVAAIALFVASLFTALSASAADIRAFVADFTVSSSDSAQLSATLKRLLASRLSGEGVIAVDAAADADVVVSASYTLLGKVFSLDAAAKTATGKPLASAFEQGDSIDSLIPAVGKLSAKLREEISKKYRQQSEQKVAIPAASTPAPAAPQTPPVAPRYAAVEKAPSGEILHQETESRWTSQRLEGAQRGVAAGGPNEFFLADGNSLSLYRRDAKLTLVARTTFPLRYQVLAVDSLGAAQQGEALAFVTIYDGEAPASRVYAVEKGSLKLLAQDLPYMFRSLAPYGGPRKLYAQQMGRIDDYYGDVYEASYQGGSIQLKNPIKMPQFANIFNFDIFRDRSGKSYLTALSEDGYLVVYSGQGKEIWRSSDKFGGSETNFQRRDTEFERFSGSRFRSRFLDQRITVTSQGEILVPQNTGFLNIGNLRSYSKYSVCAFTWNGSSLEERWRTKLSQNYLADYQYLPESKELVLLEVVQKEGPVDAGGSAVKVLRVD